MFSILVAGRQWGKIAMEREYEKLRAIGGNSIDLDDPIIRRYPDSYRILLQSGLTHSQIVPIIVDIAITHGTKRERVYQVAENVAQSLCLFGRRVE